ncbi:MAG: VRR-NUC domain-containing protein [Clostridia bacterium]|nr:VRR-NUC domain-containing protein [Clostridia bacterium]
MRHIESNIQTVCVTWFRLRYKRLAPLLFAVPNGGARNRVEAAIMKGEGVLAGVSDLLFLYPSGQYHGLCIEMKAPDGRQRDSQKEWQKAVEEQGYKYILCFGIEEFQTKIKEYLNESADSCQQMAQG